MAREKNCKMEVSGPGEGGGGQPPCLPSASATDMIYYTDNIGLPAISFSCKFDVFSKDQRISNVET